jgi:predicted ArsR family transcriptional regulator
VSPVLSVTDLGPGFQLDPSRPVDPAAPGGRGLHIASRLAPDLTARARAAGGAVVTATLPVSRTPAPPLEAPRRNLGALPALDEAQPDGAFGRESFLRALAVQIAQTVERREGPDEAGAVIAQVGADVGGQMEQEYRRAVGVEGRLSPQQVAECYVRLKAAIGGGFRVEEIHDDRVVLVNDRCPFGDAVRHAPSLCGLTSTIFGSIAAANSERGAAVALEERIAVGDTTCRVVVWFDDAIDDAPPFAHTYPRPLT